MTIRSKEGAASIVDDMFSDSVANPSVMDVDESGPQEQVLDSSEGEAVHPNLEHEVEPFPRTHRSNSILEHMVHADFYNNFEDLFDDDDLN